MSESLTNQQAMRYNRHIVLPKVDLDGQEALLNANICIIGIGGLGTAAATSLCASGVGSLTLIDHDTVEATNLPRQTLFCEKDVGTNKVEAAKARLTAINSDCDITVMAEPFSAPGSTKGTSQLSPALRQAIEGADVVLDCTDNTDSRDLINLLCFKLNTPLVSGAAIRFEGQLFVAIPGESRCYACLRKLFESPDLSCVEAGIFSPVVNIVGTYQAMLAMQVLMDFDNIPKNTLMTFDALSHEWRNWKLPKGVNCELCAC
ncbi:molybdopterin-synthase adenylyltransferase MoeB [Alteromonas sp. BL110]|uniref:HesA/MoeB/ThiF family protein n=1 Tax=Alteromonas sp. BL110 TaxID=1714845 RepID=UPI000E52EE32|nr:ThiF family adenylyltransferase [Alteromonas sp. BL110]AXT40073.1 molybdopterin-synthase adenylyltransferase MoeB [Alteromonas sp. BL110]RKM79304.1 molybdopterin-synthase adenylyltransferase MoeB [Alteromonas sp. BL110]